MKLLSWMFLFAGLAAADHAVIVVRHAERAAGSGNEVPLSEAGQCRAEKLAAMLADAGVRTAFSSEAARTRLTAVPLARKLGIEVQAHPGRDTKGLAERVREAARTGAVLVSGHSNTVPEIVEQLGGGKAAPIAETEFDRMYVVVPGSPALLLRYAGCVP